MVKKSVMTIKDEEEICRKIAKKTHDYMKKIIERELSYASKTKEVKAINITNIILIALSSLDANILTMLQKILESNSKNPVPLYLLMSSHFSGVSDILDIDGKKQLKERMN